MQNVSLDIDAVRAFVRVSELQSFTRAAQAAGTTQSAVSLQLKRLETRLEQRLIERTPRSVQLTAQGAAFLDRARDLLAAHDRALAGADVAERRLTIGIGDHVAGPNLPGLLSHLSNFDPNLHLDVRIDYSSKLLEAMDEGTFDAVVVRGERHQRGGETLSEDRLGWFAAPSFRHTPGDRLRLAMLAGPCGVRAQAVRVLDKAKISWVEAFTGGGVAAIAAAVTAGLAVAPLATRVTSPGMIDVETSLGLPSLGRSKVLLYSRVSDVRARAALRALAAAFRGIAAKR